MAIQFEYQVKENSIIVKEIDIDLNHTLFSGQAFRWQKDRMLKLKQISEKI